MIRPRRLSEADLSDDLRPEVEGPEGFLPRFVRDGGPPALRHPAMIPPLTSRESESGAAAPPVSRTTRPAPERDRTGDGSPRAQLAEAPRSAVSSTRREPADPPGRN